MNNFITRFFTVSVDTLIADLKKVADRLALHAHIHAVRNDVLAKGAALADSEAKRAQELADKIHALIN